MTRISDDGVVWYDVDADLFRTMVADESINFWVDLSSDRLGVCHVDATFFRALLKKPPGINWDNPPTLYGLPIVYTEES